MAAERGRPCWWREAGAAAAVAAGHLKPAAAMKSPQAQRAAGRGGRGGLRGSGGARGERRDPFLVGRRAAGLPSGRGVPGAGGGPSRCRRPAALGEDEEEEEEEDGGGGGLDEALGEFDAVLAEFSCPAGRRRFHYGEHLERMKRRSSASVSDGSGLSDSESECPAGGSGGGGGSTAGVKPARPPPRERQGPVGEKPVRFFKKPTSFHLLLGV